MKLVLASTSKFTSAIMDKVKMKHVCIKSDFEEVSSSNDVYEYVKDLAYGKALSVDKMVSNAIIVGIDTIVYMDNKYEGTESNLAAKRMLDSSGVKYRKIDKLEVDVKCLN